MENAMDEQQQIKAKILEELEYEDLHPKEKFKPEQIKQRHRELVRHLAGIGLKTRQIMAALESQGLFIKTVYQFDQNFKKDVEAGIAVSSEQVAQTLFDAATSGKNLDATIYWTKSKMGWMDESARRKIELEEQKIELVKKMPNANSITFSWQDDKSNLKIEAQPQGNDE